MILLSLLTYVLKITIDHWQEIVGLSAFLLFFQNQRHWMTLNCRSYASFRAHHKKLKEDRPMLLAYCQRQNVGSQENQPAPLIRACSAHMLSSQGWKLQDHESHVSYKQRVSLCKFEVESSSVGHSRQRINRRQPQQFSTIKIQKLA